MKANLSKYLLLLLLLLHFTGSIAQEKRNKTILKTNVLNLIMLPSIHLEQQIGKSTSLQLNFHRGSLVFISNNEWINASINTRKYFGKQKTSCLGWYAAGGLALNYNLLESRLNRSTQEIYKGDASLGPEFRIGGQLPFKNSRFSLDLNTGVVAPFIPLQPYGYGEGLQLRLFLGLGYNLVK